MPLRAVTGRGLFCYRLGQREPLSHGIYGPRLHHWEPTAIDPDGKGDVAVIGLLLTPAASLVAASLALDGFGMAGSFKARLRREVGRPRPGAGEALPHGSYPSGGPTILSLPPARAAQGPTTKRTGCPAPRRFEV